MTRLRQSLPRPVAERLRQLAALPSETTDERGGPPTFSAIATAESVLKRLAQVEAPVINHVHLTAVRHGALAMEWATDDGQVLIVTVPAQRGGAFSIFRTTVDLEREEETVVDNLSELPALLRAMQTPRAEHAPRFVSVAEDERLWDEQFGASADMLARLAHVALMDARAGRTAPLDIDGR
jgi:hypothetical protein